MKALIFVLFDKPMFGAPSILYKKDFFKHQNVNEVAVACARGFKSARSARDVLTIPGYICVRAPKIRGLAVLSLKTLMEPLAKSSIEQGYAIQISHDNTLLYQYPDDLSAIDQHRYGELLLTDSGLNWKIKVWPSELVLRASGSKILLLFGLLGAVFAILMTVIVRFWQIAKRQHELLAAQEVRIRHIAYHDALTGVPNRAHFEIIAKQKIKEMKRQHKMFAILILDLDLFKNVNDSFGHHAGDHLLKKVAERIQSGLRESDMFARLGGDEFIILLNDINSAHDCERVAEKVIQQITQPYNIFGHEVKISASIGIAVFPKNGRNLSELLRKADIAMYEAKKSGKGQRFSDHERYRFC